ncbi:hypothetical protein [Halorientalis sp.]|uniref:hypothetical protein n=1 Tax=Halorientalis sp. TaxID=1931229 RepID=UPI002615EB52|nr:hypothetical protein [Halorientalis sp.]
MNWWKRYDDFTYRIVPMVGGLGGMVFLLVQSGPGEGIVSVGPITVDAFYFGLVAFLLWFCFGVSMLFEDDPYEHLP